MNTEYAPPFLISVIGISYAIATIRNPKKWSKPLRYIGGPIINFSEKVTKFFGYIMFIAFFVIFLISIIRTFVG